MIEPGLALRVSLGFLRFYEPPQSYWGKQSRDESLRELFASDRKGRGRGVPIDGVCRLVLTFLSAWTNSLIFFEQFLFGECLLMVGNAGELMLSVA